jgi:Leucine-rich repeat (LRR) protein
MRIPLLSWLFLISICLLSISFCISTVFGQCLGNQQSLLLQLKDSLVFDRASSTKLVHWNPSVDCCSWEGVTCNEGRVIGLDLTNESISGGFNSSSSLFSLQYLQHLGLACNNFSNQIPSQFDRLTNLGYLNLSNACFTGQIPIAISQLTRLVSLDLSTSYMDHCVFDSLKLENPNLNMLVQNLSELTELYLDRVNISVQGSEWGTALSSSLPKLRVLSLSHCHLSGPIPMFVFEFPSLERLDLSHNKLGLAFSKLKTFPQVLINQSTLSNLDLSANQIHGDIPNWIWNLRYLDSLNLSYNYLKTLDLPLLNMSSVHSLDLRSNQLQGQLSVFPKYARYLDFSKNNFSCVIPASIGDSLSEAYFFSLSSNKVYGTIPGSICNATNLRVLDLSDNFLSDTIPQCLFKMSEGQMSSDQGLAVLNLRRNNLTGTISNTFPNNCGLQTLSLNGNQLKGKLPKSLARCTSLEVLNLGNNHIKDAFPCYLKNISMLHILILRSNKFYGPIDCRGCNASWPKLQIVDLAANNFTGKLPIKHFSNWKAITDDKNEAESQLNHLQFGSYSKSDSYRSEFGIYSKVSYSSQFGSCSNHNIYAREDQFGSCSNRNIYAREDQFGSCSYRNIYAREDQFGSCSKSDSYGRVRDLVIDIYYQDVITVTMKGLEAKLERILTIFNSLDFSCNNFDGPIPEEVGELKLLYILNLSHNAFTGQIPQSLGKLSNLESLDLSSNKFTGDIPFQLAEGLTFLSVFNLSFNQLVGKIPQIKQFGTFLETSYEGNIGLCGFPLKEKCTREEPGLSLPTSKETHSNSRINAIDWNFLSAELGFIFGFGIIIGPLMFWKRWRICYYKHVDDIFFNMFPRLYIRIENRQRRVQRNQRQRAHQNQGRRH